MTATAAEAPKPKPKPAFQYQTEGIAIAAPSADEPKMPAFDGAAVRAAARYLDEGAVAWVRRNPASTATPPARTWPSGRR